MEYLIGLILSLTVDGSGTVIGYDPGRAFYPTALSVIFSYLCIVRRNGSFWALAAH